MDGETQQAAPEGVSFRWYAMSHATSILLYAE
jgi:hypothetical protein